MNLAELISQKSSNLCRYFLADNKQTKSSKQIEQRKDEGDWFQARKEAAEKKKQAAVEAAEKRKRAAEEAAEKRKQAAAEAEAQRQAAAEKRAEQAVQAEAQRQAAADKRAERAAQAEAQRQAAADKRAEREAQAEAQRQAAADKRADALARAEAKKKEAEEKRKLQQQKKAAQEAVNAAAPSSTISLGFFNFGQKSQDREESSTAKVSSAPRGVPSLSKWRQNSNGSITGDIAGSNAYKDGESITTSPIAGNIEGGTVVQTKSGSKYYLEPKATSGGFFGISQKSVSTTRASEAADQRRSDTEKRKRQAAAAAEEKRRLLDEQKKKAIEAAVAKRKAAETKKQAKADTKAFTEQPSGRTFSLGLFNFGQQDTGASASVDSGATTPPRGVPSLSKWRQNRDGSISGSISGSPAFKNGEIITTSPVSGNIADGAIVTTSSGSRYVDV